MMRGLGLVIGAAAMLCGAPAQAQMTPAQQAAIAGDPAAKPQRLALVDLPNASGAPVTLFNGRDLADWESWLGYADPGLTYKRPAIAPLGTSADTSQAFSVVTEEGAPALRVEGKTWGSLVHKGDYRDYHLSLEFKWGDQLWAPRLTLPQNNGLLFHSHGAPDEVTMARVATSLGARGTLKTLTLTAIDVETFIESLGDGVGG